MDAAFLVGISTYPDHKLHGVTNDLAILAAGLRQHNYPASATHIFDDTCSTRAELHELFSRIFAAYDAVEHGTCYLHVSASGALQPEPLVAGILPRDGDLQDFSTAFAFNTLNGYLPFREGIRVIVTLDT